jgi:hypothetical protein
VEREDRLLGAACSCVEVAAEELVVLLFAEDGPVQENLLVPSFFVVVVLHVPLEDRLSWAAEAAFFLPLGVVLHDHDAYWGVAYWDAAYHLASWAEERCCGPSSLVQQHLAVLVEGQFLVEPVGHLVSPLLI